MLFRSFLSAREDAWRLGDQLPREDVVQTKAEVALVPEAAFQCEVAQNLTSPRALTRGPANLLNRCPEAGHRLRARGDEGDEIQCEVAQSSAVSKVEPEPELKVGALDAAHITPTHTPFRSLSTQTPQPGHPDYHRWIKNQSWARM